MLNITFDASTQGVIHFAKDHDSGNLITSRDILDFELALDIGWLRPGIFSVYRRRIQDQLILAGSSVEDPDLDIFESENIKNLKIFQERAETGEKIRIWYSKSPSEFCSFHYFCSLLNTIGNYNVYAVLAPEIDGNEKNQYFIHGWGQVGIENINQYVSFQRLMTKNEIKLYAEKWRELTEENAKLRAVITNTIVSVNDDFYDLFIMKCLSDSPIKQSQLIEKLVGMGLGVDYGWFIFRVDRMIETGEITVINKPDANSMHRWLQKRKHDVKVDI